MAERYSISDGSTIGKIIPRPSSWNGTILADNPRDSTMRALGLWPVKVNDPGFGVDQRESGRSLAFSDDGQFVIETVIYDLISVDERKAAMRDRAEREYQASLERGFQFDGGTFPATGEKRRRVVEIVTKINAGRGLPQGKNTLRFFDKSGTAHNLGATGVIDLADMGDNLVDAADDRLAQLIASIESASSQSDLDAIDLTIRWPS